MRKLAGDLPLNLRGQSNGSTIGESGAQRLRIGQQAERVTGLSA